MKYMRSILSVILGPFYAIVLFKVAAGIRLGAGLLNSPVIRRA